MSSINSIVNETVELSSIHGLSNLAKSKNILLKSTWLLCMLTSAVLCCNVITKSIIEYLKFEVVSRVDVKYEDQLIFPIVTFCPSNPFATDFAKNYFADVEKRFVADNANLTELVPSLKYKFYIKKFNVLLNSTIYAERKKFGLNLKDILISCIYNFQDCNSSSDFEEHYDFYYGNCFRFNPKGNKLAIQSGALNGLQMEIFTGSLNEKNDFMSSENSISVVIHNNTQYEYSNLGIKLAPGFSHNIVLNKKTITQIPKPFSNCIADLNSENSYDSNIYKNFIKSHKSYMQSNCKFMCFQEYLANECQCQYTNLYNYYGNKPACLSLNQSNCSSEALSRFIKTNLISKCDCPFECERTIYGYSSSFSEYPSKFYGQLLTEHPLIKSKFPNKSSITHNDLKKSILSLTIFYDELKETFIHQEKKALFIDLISKVGGTLGLFLGMSFLSFIELYELFIRLVAFLIRKRIKSRLINQAKILRQNIKQPNNDLVVFTV